MKKILLLLFCLGLFSATSYAQNANKDRIKEIQTELDNAVEAGDFEKAAKLKKERDIRLEIETAIEAGDFDKAAELKQKLKNLENGRLEDNQTPQNEPMQKTPPNKPEKKQSEENSERKLKNYVTGNGFYMDAFIGFGAFDYFNSFGYVAATGPSLGYRLGNKFFLKKWGSENFRVGIDVNWFGANMIPTTIADSSVIGMHLFLLNPGFGIAKSFNRKIGFEANLLIGPSFVGDSENGPEFGLRLSPQFKFRMKVFSIGVEYCMGRGFGNETLTSSFGMIAGFKF